MKTTKGPSYYPAGGLSNSLLQMLSDHYGISPARLIKEDLMSYVINEKNYSEVANLLLFCNSKSFDSDEHKTNYVVKSLKSKKDY